MQKVNDSIINGRAILSASDLDTLASLLTAPYTKREIEDIRCFLPHHGILIYKKARCSYFDICFGCRHFITSRDIKISDILLDSVWQSMETFFINRGLTYEMPSLVIETDE